MYNEVEVHNSGGIVHHVLVRLQAQDFLLFLRHRKIPAARTAPELREHSAQAQTFYKSSKARLVCVHILPEDKC